VGVTSGSKSEGTFPQMILTKVRNTVTRKEPTSDDKEPLDTQTVSKHAVGSHRYLTYLDRTTDRTINSITKAD
jgi:hypothetical protein